MRISRSESKMEDIVYSEKIIPGQESLPMSQRKFPHPETGEPMSYAGYMNYVEDGKAIHPEELYSTIIKYTQVFNDDDGVVRKFYFDRTKSTKGPFEVEIIYPDGDDGWFDPDNLVLIPNQEHLPMSQRKLPSPENGEPIGYSTYMKYVKEGLAKHPEELYNPILTRDPKELNKRQKDLPISQRTYVHPKDIGYIGYAGYMNFVKQGIVPHPDKI